MAVILKSNFYNFLVVVFLIAAYSSEVRAKPATESPENGIASNDLDKTTKPTPTGRGFFIEFDPQSAPEEEEMKKLKQAQKKVEGSTEKSKLSKSKEPIEEKKTKKIKPATQDDVPASVNYDEKDTAGAGWDVASVLDKDDSDYEDVAVKDVDISNSPKDKGNTLSKKSKVWKSEPAATEETSEEVEPLPSAQRQKSRPATTLRPTTTEPSTTVPNIPTTGSASTNLPRALCSFVVTVATVMLVL